MMLVALIFCMGGAVSSAAGVFYMLNDNELLGLALHGIGILLATSGVMQLLPERLRSAPFLSVLLCASLVTLLPMVGVIVLLFLSAQFRKPISLRDEELPYVFGDQLDLKHNIDVTRTFLSQSVVDVLHGSDATARRNAVLALKNVAPKQSIPILRKGVQDSDEQVRIYAQNILAGILEQQDRRMKEIEARLKESPDDPAALLRLAEQFYDSVYLGVAADEVGRTSLLQKAEARLNQILQSQPGHLQAWMLRLKCSVRLGDVLRAEECLQRLEQLGLQEEMILPWRMELLFLRRQWGELRNTFRSFSSTTFSYPKLEPLADFWGGNRSPAL